MFFISWRGWGLLALALLIPPAAACGGLMEFDPVLALFCFGGALFAGGQICLHCGKKWNQGSGYHALYWIPLEIWGWIYLVVGGSFAVLGAIAILKQAMVG